MSSMGTLVGRWLLALALAAAFSACRSPEYFRRQADTVAESTVGRLRKAKLGDDTPFSVAPASERLRQRLLKEQGLPSAPSPAHWEGENDTADAETAAAGPAAGPLSLSLSDALQVAARNSRDYQTQKEGVFSAALALDLQEDAFRSTLAGVLVGNLTGDRAADPDRYGTDNRGSFSLTRQFRNGLTVTQTLGLDVVKLLSGSHSSALGLMADASILVPLMRNSGRLTITENLTQAERETIYAIYEFERFKRSFAVQVASDYLGVLRRLDEVANAEENYRRLVASRRLARRLADAGRLPEIQVDQALQDELRARDRWIAANQGYAQTLDRFKLLLGLPPDATVELQREELTGLVAAEAEKLKEAAGKAKDADATIPPADAPITLTLPEPPTEGWAALSEARAIELAFGHRLDLRVTAGRVIDRQRQVLIAADQLRPELNLLASASAGEGRSLGSAELGNGKLRLDRGLYALDLQLDLPLERTAERNNYREQLLAMDQAMRDYEEAQDTVKYSVREGLRNLRQQHESVLTQARAVDVAQRRVRSTDLFLRAGRAQIRDVLEAQEALLSVQNSFTAALVNYRVSELELQRDLGVLEVGVDGLWQEGAPMEGLPDAN